MTEMDQIEVLKKESYSPIVNTATQVALGIMNYEEFGFRSEVADVFGVPAARIGAQVVIATLLEMGIIDNDIDANRFNDAAERVRDEVHQQIMQYRLT